VVTLTFIDSSGTEFPVVVPAGTTVMEAAILHEVPSIVGFCGGMCACGTCHCYPVGDPARRLSAPDENENDTLQRVLDRRADSRLGCQIRLDETLSGLVIRLPARQRPL